MNIRPILSQKEIKGGCGYLYMHEFGRSSYIISCTITKKPHKSPSTGDWLIGSREYFPADEYSSGFVTECTFSLEDVNVIPNSYNNHSLWKNTVKTRQFLESVGENKNGEYAQYLAILARFNRGTICDSLSAA